jgi:hypothetical protein
MNGDIQPIIIKCTKNGKKFRTYILNAEQHFDTIERCYKIFAKIKKGLGTSMEVKSSSENNDDKNILKNNENLPNDESSDDTPPPDSSIASNTQKTEKPEKPEKPEKSDKPDKKKKKKIHKTINYVNDPVFSFGGDQINKIIKFLTTNKYVSNEMIKV